MPQYYGDKPHDHSWDQMEPGQMEQNARRLDRHSQEPCPKPGNENETKIQKTRETIAGTLPETTRIEEMMTEQNVRIFGTKKSWWNIFFLDELRTPFSSRAVWATRPGTQPEPGTDDGTGCQKSRETSPGTLVETRK